MKLMLVPAILLLALPGATVRFDADGVKVGGETVAEKTIGLKTAGELPILVSNSVVENLSSTGKALEVAVLDKTVLLDAGIRLDRKGDGFRLSTHGPAFSLEAAGRTIAAEGAVAFKVTEKGFDLGALGLLEGATLAAKIAPRAAEAKAAAQDPPDPTLLRGRTRQQATRPPYLLHRTFGNADFTVAGEGADSQAIRMLLRVTPTGSP